MLSLRTDVMNKNLFRAIRRQCKGLYNDFLSANNLSKSKKQLNMEQFSTHLLSMTNVEGTTNQDFDSKDFMTYLGIFSNYCAMKKILKGNDSKDKLEKVYSVLYSYSHIKFNEFMLIPEIRVIIKIIVERSGTQSLIQSNSTLAANHESYSEHINKLLKSFN